MNFVGGHLYKNVADHLVTKLNHARSKVAVSQKLSREHPLPILSYPMFYSQTISYIPSQQVFLPIRLPSESESFMLPSQDSIGSCLSVSVLTLLSCFQNPTLERCSGQCLYYLCGLDLEGYLGPPPHPLFLSPRGKSLMG